ncbi:hypothetical protein V8G54_016716 [Vigna mungo]|uniref:Uncharacterized protein n=1 Tax=Vigna mungo TaxID=3915 RepID=A0AAQ3NNK7_VIGMU
MENNLHVVGLMFDLVSTWWVVGLVVSRDRMNSLCTVRSPNTTRPTDHEIEWSSLGTFLDQNAKLRKHSSQTEHFDSRSSLGTSPKIKILGVHLDRSLRSRSLLGLFPKIKVRVHEERSSPNGLDLRSSLGTFLNIKVRVHEEHSSPNGLDLRSSFGSFLMIKVRVHDVPHRTFHGDAARPHEGRQIVSIGVPVKDTPTLKSVTLRNNPGSFEGGKSHSLFDSKRWIMNCISHILVHLRHVIGGGMRTIMSFFVVVEYLRLTVYHPFARVERKQSEKSYMNMKWEEKQECLSKTGEMGGGTKMMSDLHKSVKVVEKWMKVLIGLDEISRVFPFVRMWMSAAHSDHPALESTITLNDPLNVVLWNQLLHFDHPILESIGALES